MKMNWGCYLKDGLRRPRPVAQSPKREMDSSASNGSAFLVQRVAVQAATVRRAADCGNGSNVLRLRHMLSSTTASLSPHRRSSESGPKRPKMYCADCTSKLRR